MKVLFLNYSDNFGGASIAARRLFTQLYKYNIDITFGTIEKNINDSINLLSINKKWDNIFKRYFLFRIIKKIYLYITTVKINIFKTSNPVFHSENKNTLIDIDSINKSDYNIIHFHWINADMISIEDIAKIKKPVVWTMHDCWPFCGAEHYPNILENDNRFFEGYTKANKPYTTLGPDICRKTWERKKKSWKDFTFNFISPSNYEKKSFDNSALFKNNHSTCRVIPNIVPCNIFKPIDKIFLKNIYQIPLEKIIIGFGAAYDITYEKSIKGGYLLIEALNKIKNKSNYHFVVFGNADIKFLEKIEIPIFFSGFITNPLILVGIYNLCDVIVCPSLQENLPNICLESLFCGIPVAAFNTGGIPDIVEHRKTGYLANCFDTEDLFNGIMYCIDNYYELSQNSITKAQTDFNNETVIKKHIELYESVLRNNQEYQLEETRL